MCLQTHVSVPQDLLVPAARQVSWRPSLPAQPENGFLSPSFLSLSLGLCFFASCFLPFQLYIHVYLKPSLQSNIPLYVKKLRFLQDEFLKGKLFQKCSGLLVLMVKGFLWLNNQLFFDTRLQGKITSMVKQIKMSSWSVGTIERVINVKQNAAHATKACN